jgi:hypothetical protein
MQPLRGKSAFCVGFPRVALRLPWALRCNAFGVENRAHVSDQFLLAGLEKAARRYRRGGQQVEDGADADADAEAHQAAAAVESEEQEPNGQECDECADAQAGPAEGFLGEAVGRVQNVGEGQGGDVAQEAENPAPVRDDHHALAGANGGQVDGAFAREGRHLHRHRQEGEEDGDDADQAAAGQHLAAQPQTRQPGLQGRGLERGRGWRSGSRNLFTGDFTSHGCCSPKKMQGFYVDVAPVAQTGLPWRPAISDKFLLPG